MKKNLWLFAVLCMAVMCTAAITIEWYSQQPHFASLNDNDLTLFERPNPHGYGWVYASQIKAYIGNPVSQFPPTITSFNNNKGSVEIGSTVSGTVLTWALGGGTPTVQSINQGIGGVPIGTLTATDGTSYTSSRTYTLTESNPNGTATANTTVSFLSKRYWGPSSVASGITDGQIIALNSELASGFAGFNHTIVCAGEYIYFAFPTSFGVPNVNVNGLLNTAWTIVNRTFVNASGFSTSYYIYRSDNLLTGTFIVQLVP